MQERASYCELLTGGKHPVDIFKEDALRILPRLAKIDGLSTTTVNLGQRTALVGAIALDTDSVAYCCSVTHHLVSYPGGAVMAFTRDSEEGPWGLEYIALDGVHVAHGVEVNPQDQFAAAYTALCLFEDVAIGLKAQLTES